MRFDLDGTKLALPQHAERLRAFLAGERIAPVLVEIFIDPEQRMVPKLEPIYVRGKATSPPFWDLSPRIE